MPGILSVRNVNRSSDGALELVGQLLDGEIFPGELLRVEFQHSELIAGLHIRSTERLHTGELKLSVDMSLFRDPPPLGEWPLVGHVVESYKP